MGGWNILGYGLFDKVAAQVDKSHAALRTSLRPPEAGIYGSYRLSVKSGVMAAGIAGNSPVWEFRWGANSILAIIRKLRIQAVASTTAFNATAADSSFSLFRMQGFTAMDTTGGLTTAFTKPKSCAVSTRMAASQLAGDATALRSAQGGIVISNTGALSGGAWTADSAPIATVLNRIVASAAAETVITPEPAPYLIDPAECPVACPLELSLSEGIVLFADAITATGTWRLQVDVAWDEVDPARYFGTFG